ncbi:MAG TPA: hypothetical protein VFJ16_11180 [Longimicrobium sp.]|nr:hypothetical protein [Longimicrobium sp.]
MSKKGIRRHFASFEGVYTSGLYVKDPRVLTELCLIFDKVHIPNNLSLLLELAKRHDFSHSALQKLHEQDIKFDFDIKRPDAKSDPLLDELTDAQRSTVANYIIGTLLFNRENRELLGEVIEARTAGVSSSEEIVSHVEYATDDTSSQIYLSDKLYLGYNNGSDINSIVQSGAIPISDFPSSVIDSTSSIPFVQKFASLIALEAVRIAFPKTVQAQPDEILEARDRLRDHLPLFWQAMLKLGAANRKSLEEGSPEAEIKREAREIVEGDVRPALIELERKIELERRQWFYRVFGPIARHITLSAGKSLLPASGILKTAIVTGAGATLEIAEAIRTAQANSSNSDLTYLVELTSLFSD